MSLSTLRGLSRRCIPSSKSDFLVPQASQVPGLPPELIEKIISYLRDESKTRISDVWDTTNVLTAMARVCRLWYNLVMPHIYIDIAPVNLLSCKLLIRTVKIDQSLSVLVRSLTIPMDDGLYKSSLFGETFAGLRPGVIPKLVSLLPGLKDLGLNMDSTVRWTESLIRVNFPSMVQLRHLKSLRIFGQTPRNMKRLNTDHVSLWFCQTSALPRLEYLTLSFMRWPLAFSAIQQWPSMPSLHYLHFHQIEHTPLHHDVPTLLTNTKDSLKTLHISYDFSEHLGAGIFLGLEHSISAFRFPFIASCVLELSLETLIVICPTWYDARFETDTQHWSFSHWEAHDLANMVALKRLHISDMFIHRNLFTNPPPLLTTLIIAVHDPVRRPIDFRDLFEILPSTVKTLICEVGGTNTDDQWIYLAKHARIVDDSRMDHTPVPPVPGGELNVQLRLNFDSILTTILDETELVAHMQALKKLIAARTHTLGINFRLEPLRDLKPAPESDIIS
ncbi:hypothetical protein BU17DRAFT_102676 [Hysterangium stoloniferum]|nr:hypothetical protein BU17DRAFT_102676 [Hysterangium stoloniferum]